MIKLPNTGTQPLIASEGRSFFSKTASTQEGKRHLKLEMYELRGGDFKLAFHVQYTSDWPQEVPRDYSRYADSLNDLARKLSHVRPRRWVRGYPHGKQFERKQVDLLNEIDARWKQLVSDALIIVEVP